MKKTKQTNGAVIYVRVSTDEQASGPLNLQNQEKRCEEFCARHGWQVLKIFTDAGASARTVDRPEFQRMIQFCKDHRAEVGYVVVQDLSRFARNNKDQAETIVKLKKVGVLLRSTYEPNLDETAAGKLAANMIGSFNQFFSDALSEKMRERTRQSVIAGRFPWRAPIGYINIGGKTGANIKPDPKRAPYIRQAFDLVATGRYTKAEVLNRISEGGLRTSSGRPLTPQTFHAMLRNPLYAGWVTLPSDDQFEPVRGLHETLVSQELFDTVQAILSGKRPTVVPKRKFNPEFPLKRIVRCSGCGKPITWGFAKGRSKKYGRYWCRTAGCRAVRLSREELEADFTGLLNTLRPTPEARRGFPKVAARVWATKQGDAEKKATKVERRIKELRELRAALLEAKLRGEVTLEDYTEANANYRRESEALEQELQAVNCARQDTESFVRFAELQLVDISGAWQIANPEQRIRIQNLLFKDGLEYSPKQGILNRSNSSLFSMLLATTTQEGLLASPTGFEPVLSP